MIIDICIGDRYAMLQQWASSDDLQRFLSTCQNGSVLLQGASGVSDQYMSIALHSHENASAFGIGISYYSHGLRAQVLPITLVRQLWIGFETTIVRIDAYAQTVLAVDSLDSPFYSFITLAKTEVVLVLEEYALTARTLSGAVEWKWAREIISGISVDDHVAHIRCMDGWHGRVSLLNGEVVQ